MSRKTGKKKHTLLIVLAILLVVPATAALILMTHTQIIVGTIQKLSASTVNPKSRVISTQNIRRLERPVCPETYGHVQ